MTSAIAEWASLCDAQYAQRCCETIAEAMRGGKRSWLAMAATIGDRLLSPLGAYLKEHHRVTVSTDFEAGARLRGKAENLVDNLRAAVHPFTEDEVRAYTEALQAAWLEFIAHAAGPAVYDDLLKAQTQRQAAGKQLRGNGAQLSVELLVERLAASGGRLTKALKLSLSEEFGVDERTVERRLKTARDRGLVH